MSKISLDGLKRAALSAIRDVKKFDTRSPFAAIAIALIALGGCSATDPALSDPPAPSAAATAPSPGLAASGLLGPTWNVVGYADGPAMKGVYNTMEFTADGSAGGRSACNAWRGPVEVTGDQLRFGATLGTMMACPEAAMIAERRFLSQLPNVRGYQIKGDALILRNTAGATVMKLTSKPFPKGLDALPERGDRTGPQGKVN